MTFQDLKKVARDHYPPIKKYYQMNKLQLITFLCMKELPEEMLVAKMTIPELRESILKKEKGRQPNLWKLTRSDLVERLKSCPKQDDKNDDNRKKHDCPHHSDPD